MYYLKLTDEFGRGLYAERTILKGQTIMRCELLVLSPEDTIVVNKTALQYYTFTYNDDQDCLVLGDAEIFNHASGANVEFHLEQIKDRKIMVFKALDDIATHSQLFINYESDSKVNALEYITQKSLVG